MLEFPCRICLRMDVGNLLELQRALERDRVVQSAPDIEHILVKPVLLRKRLNRFHIGKNFRDLRRNLE